MKPIKFRAWDKRNETMANVDGFTGLEKDDSSQFKYITCSEGKGVIDWEDIILMQFTGLKDKNGKEIYEGDIVNIWANPKDYGGYKGHNYQAVVEWCEDNLAFILNDGHGLRDFEFIKILGNIYENPELLED